jgi:hypothetical protein
MRGGRKSFSEWRRGSDSARGKVTPSIWGGWMAQFLATSNRSVQCPCVLLMTKPTFQARALAIRPTGSISLSLGTFRERS